MSRFLIIVFMIMAGHNLSAQTKRELKKAQKIENFQNNKNIVESSKYSFIASSARTKYGLAFNFGNSNAILTIIGNNSIAELPYMGAMKKPKNSDSTRVGRITYQNEKISYNIKYNQNKGKIIVKFSTKNKNENFDIILTVYDKNRADLSIISNKRDPIKYYGRISKLEP